MSNEVGELSLIEWQPCEVSPALALQLLKKPDWFDVSRTLDGAFRVRAKNVIGVIPLDGVVVRVAPKLPISNLVAMLELVHDLPSLEIHEVATPMADIAGVVDRFAHVFASRVLRRLRTGIHRTYVTDEEELVIVRGRVSVAGSIRAIAAARPRLHCEFEELTADIVDNQILLAALHVLARCSALTNGTRSLVALAYRTLGVDVSLVPIDPDDCLRRDYDRLNRDYRPLHLIARFFLEHLSVDLGAHRDSLPFTINTAHLFEAFVARWLSRSLPPGLSVAAQHQLCVSSDGRFESRIDLVLRRGGLAVAVLDTKYKDAADVGRGDLHQIVYYATALTCAAAILVYPNVATPMKVAVGSVHASSLTFDLSKPIVDAGAQFLEGLLSECPGVG